MLMREEEVMLSRVEENDMLRREEEWLMWD